MRINIQGLINRLESLRVRLNDLFDNLDSLEELEQEDIEIEDVQQYFQNDDPFNLSIALDILEQAKKLDNVLEILKNKNVDVGTFIKKCTHNADYQFYLDYHKFIMNGMSSEELTEEEFYLLKEYLK